MGSLVCLRGLHGKDKFSGVSVSLTKLFLFDQNRLILSGRLTRTRPGLCEQFLMEHLATY